MSQAAAARTRETVDTAPLALGVTAFAAMLGEEVLGCAAGEDALPKAIRRRMSPFDMNVARCVIGLSALDEGSRSPLAEDIVFASRYGNMGLTLDLLRQVVDRELLSPAKFSMAVHNAAAGISSLITGNRGGHTAIAAGNRTLQAGLTETFTRIAAGASSVMFVFSDLPLMSPYSAFDEAGDGVQLAMRLTARDVLTRPEAGPEVGEGRLGATQLARTLATGVGGLSWRP